MLNYEWMDVKQWALSLDPSLVKIQASSCGQNGSSHTLPHPHPPLTETVSSFSRSFHQPQKLGSHTVRKASQAALVVKNTPDNAGSIRDTGSIPGSGSSPGGGHGNPLQCSFLENPNDRGAWQATVHRVTKSQTRLRQLSMHASKHACLRSGN